MLCLTQATLGITLPEEEISESASSPPVWRWLPFWNEVIRTSESASRTQASLKCVWSRYRSTLFRQLKRKHSVWIEHHSHSGDIPIVSG